MRVAYDASDYRRTPFYIDDTTGNVYQGEGSNQRIVGNTQESRFGWLAPDVPQPRPPVSPEVKAGVDRILSQWSGSSGKGSAQRVIRDMSNLADWVPSDTSGASDDLRLQYAMAVLSGFKEASPSFSDKAYKSWMEHITPLLQSHKPAQQVFPLWKSTAEMMETRYGGGGEDAYTYQEPAGVNYGQWEGVAKQLGYTGPIYGVVGQDSEGGGITGYDPQFTNFVNQKRAEGYDFVQYQPDLRNYRQKYGFRLPDGQVVGEYYGEGRDADVTSFFTQFVLPSVGAYFGGQALGKALIPLENALTGAGAVGGGTGAAIGAGIAEGMAPGVLAPASAAELGAVNALTGAGGALTAGDLANLSTGITAGGGDAAVGAGGNVLTGGAAAPFADKAALYSNTGYGTGMTGAATGAFDTTLGITGNPAAANVAANIAGPAGDLLDKAINFVTSPAGSAIVSGVGNVVGGIAAGEAAKEAAQTQAAAADRALDLQTRIYEDFQRMNKPYYEAGVNALGKLTRGEITTEPGYGFRLGEGMKALERLQASRGQLLGGGAIKAGQRYAQDYASQEYGNAYNRLANLAGIGQTAATQAGQAGQNYAAQAGELGMQGANALVSGRIGRTSAYTGGIMGVANALRDYTAGQRREEMLDRLLPYLQNRP